ncbi:MAG TPA: DUF3298 domain-containing protein, partial [Stellaceae bacterium]|nr:DUF3298 domain-containing protein [Stellaceae bacterium]
QTALSDVFDRRLDRDNYVEQGSVLGFMSGAETEHVVCGAGARFDYYLTHGGDVLMAFGDVLYRLRRPEGDPRDFKPGFSGPGFDCVTADNAARKVICLDLQLSALDRKMTAAYRRLEATETPASFATVRAAQAAWFASIVRRCEAGGPLPDHADDVAAIRDCLADLYPARAELLDDAAAMKSGGDTLEPRMRFAMRQKPLFADTDSYPWLGGGGDATAFNAFVAERLGQDSERIDPDHLYVPPHFPPGVALTARRSYAVYRFDARMISVEMRTDDFTGGTHEDPHEFAINWDRAKRAPIGFADLFPLDKDGLQFATQFALKDLTRQFGAEAPPKQDDVAGVVTDPTAWLFGADAATVHFTVYSIANFSRGEFDVAIPYAALKDYLRPDATPLATAPK